MNFWKRNKTLHTSEVPPYSRCLTRRQKNKKRQIIRNKVITDREKKKQIERGEENVSAHAHMFESRDCVIDKGARLLVKDS